jgi:trimeric autotransporter adhesin
MRFRHLGMGVMIVVVLASVGWSAPQQAPTANAPGSHLVTFTGVLKDADGTPRGGAVAMKFSLYAAQDGGEALWVEQQTVVADAAGRYSMLLGAATVGGLPAEVFGDGKAQWLAAQVVGEAEAARVLLVAVPYALRATDADTLGGKTLTSFVLTENLVKAIQEQVATGTISGTTTTSSIGGTVQFGHESDSNTWFGLNAGGSISTGSSNTFLGASSGNHVDSGFHNVFLGYNSGYTNTAGNYNVFVGRAAGYANVSTTENTFVGDRAGNSNVVSSNTFVGSDAGYTNTTGTQDTFLGYEAGMYNVLGSSLTFVGYQAGMASTAGRNTMVGSEAGKATTSGGSNSFFGASAGLSNVSGAFNAFFGAMAGKMTNSGSYNTFFGAEAGQSNTTGYRNAFFGDQAGHETTTGDSNAFIGRIAGFDNTTGYRNTFVGAGTGAGNTVESGNTFVGTDALGTAGVANSTAIGTLAEVTQSNSLVLGAISGVNGASVDTNVGIGTTAPAARLHVGKGEIRFSNGNGTASHFNYLNTSVNYIRGVTYFDGASAYFTGGNLGVGTASPVAKLHVTGGEFRLMNASGQHTHFNYGNLSTNYIRGVTYFDTASVYFTGGNVGIGTTSPSYKLHVVGDIYTTGTYQGSDLRLKKNVQNLGYGLREVMRLRPVSYEWKDRATGPATFGLIAQEVATIMPELVGRSQDEAGMLSLNYVGLVPVLVKAAQEQDAKIGELKAENAELRAQIAELRALVLQLSAEKQR